MKRCNGCGAEKPLVDFQKRKASSDGHTARRRACLNAYDKTRAKAPHRVAARAAYTKTPKGMVVAAAAKAKWLAANPKAYLVHNMVNNYLRDGELTKGVCEVCGNPDTHAHHSDYDKPLDVMWLCPLHHEQWHRENGEGANLERIDTIT